MNLWHRPQLGIPPTVPEHAECFACRKVDHRANMVEIPGWALADWHQDRIRLGLSWYVLPPEAYLGTQVYCQACAPLRPRARYGGWEPVVPVEPVQPAKPAKHGKPAHKKDNRHALPT